MSIPVTGLVLTLLVVTTSEPGWAATQQQQPADRTDALRVFLDCNRCDENYLRSEITFINYVRDRATAELHVLVTTQGTGGGGTEFTLKFIGLGRFQGLNHQLSYVAAQTNTDDETRKGIARVLKLGLVRYVAETPQASQLDVSYKAPEANVAAAVRDPWNLWVFRASFRGNFEGARSDKTTSIRGSLSANRTTDRWKLEFNTNGNYRENRFLLEDEGTFVSITRTSEAKRTRSPHEASTSTGRSAAPPVSPHRRSSTTTSASAGAPGSSTACIRTRSPRAGC